MSHKANKPTPYYVSCIIFFRIFILIFLSIMIFYFKFNHEYLYETLNNLYSQTPIFNIILSESNQCPQNTKKITLGEWPGTYEGCICLDSKSSIENKPFIIKSTSCSLKKNSCKSIKQTVRKIYDKWHDTTFCASLKQQFNYSALLTTFSNYSSCGKEYKQCGILDKMGRLLCFPKTQECPLNYLEISNSNVPPSYLGSKLIKTVPLFQGTFLHYSNEVIDGEIIVDFKVGESLVCLYENEHFYNTPKYKLLKMEKCGKSSGKVLIDESFRQLDSYLQSDFFMDNGLTDIITKLPQYPLLNNVSLFVRTFPGLTGINCLDKYNFSNNRNTIKLLKKLSFACLILTYITFIYSCFGFLSKLKLNKQCNITFYIILFFLDLFILIILIFSLSKTISLIINSSCVNMSYISLITNYNNIIIYKLICICNSIILTLFPFTMLLCGSTDEKSKNYKQEIEKEIKVLEKEMNVKNIHFSSLTAMLIFSDKRIITACKEGMINVISLNYKTLKWICDIKNIKAHQGKVYDLKELKQHVLISSSKENEIKFWKVKATSMELIKTITQIHPAVKTIIPLYKFNQFVILNSTETISFYQDTNPFQGENSYDESLPIVTFIEMHTLDLFCIGCSKFDNFNHYIVFVSTQNFEQKSKFSIKEEPITRCCIELPNGNVAIGLKQLLVIIINYEKGILHTITFGVTLNGRLCLCLFNEYSFIVCGQETLKQYDFKTGVKLYETNRKGMFKGNCLIVNEDMYILCDNVYRGFSVYKGWNKGKKFDNFMVI